MFSSSSVSGPFIFSGAAFLLLLIAALGPDLAKADITWPLYNQACRDDAGPPYADDSEAFGNGKYHDGSSAYPVLQSDGQCAKPMQAACASRPSFKTAYLEGPIGCGDKGWYCRIYKDDANGWPNINLSGDVNFGLCNSTDSFEDAGYDQDGHCHGSDNDSTYYWWIRDHWHRQYNGRLRCCCGWFEGGTQPLYGRRIANRCDYRRLVTSTEDREQCRDANEDHGMGFDDIGCDSAQYQSSQLNQPIQEDDDVCWEIQRFGFTDDDDGGGGSEPTITSAPTPAPTPAPVVESTSAPTPAPVASPSPPTSAGDDSVDDDGDGTCSDSTDKFQVIKPDGTIKMKDCDTWLQRKSTAWRCLKFQGVKEGCPKTCTNCCKEDLETSFVLKGNERSKTCAWAAKNPGERCKKPPTRQLCAVTCGQCSGD